MIKDKELQYLAYRGLAKIIYWASIIRLMLCVYKPFHSIWGVFGVLLLMVVAGNVCQQLAVSVSILQIFPHDCYYSEVELLNKSYWIVPKDKLNLLYFKESGSDSLVTKCSKLKARLSELRICLRGFKRNNGLLDKAYILVDESNQLSKVDGNAILFTSMKHAEAWAKRHKNSSAYIMPVEINMGGEDRA